MTNQLRLVAAAAVAASSALATTASALDLVQGYQRGANLPEQLGSDFILDQAATGGGDATLATAPSSFGWVAQYTDLWDVGADVSITGLAVPIHTNSNNLPSSSGAGDWTFTFFDLGGGADPNAFDGYDFDTMTGEDVLGSVTATLAEPVGNATDEYFLAFDAPLDFTAASTGLAFHMQSTGTMRVKVNTPSENRRAERVDLATGAPLDVTNSSFAATLAGTPVALDPPPPPPLAHRLDAAMQTGGNRIWETVAPSIEQYAFNLPQAGDYNGDGLTNAADYTLARGNLGGDASVVFTDGSRDPSNTDVIGQPDLDYWAANYGSPTTVAVNDPSVPGITQAFRGGATGQASAYEVAVNELQAARQDGSFEVWFKPDDLSGGEQIIFEIGGTGTGSYLSLDGDQLSFYVNGQFDGNEQTLTTTLSDAAWTQVAVVIHNTYDPEVASPDDYVDLYVDGVLAASTISATTDINRWAGGNQAGIGQIGGNAAAGGPIAGDTSGVDLYAFDGQIAIFEYATAAWDSAEVAARYNGITNGSAAAVPEPASALLIGLALAPLAARRWQPTNGQA